MSAAAARKLFYSIRIEKILRLAAGIDVVHLGLIDRLYGQYGRGFALAVPVIGKFLFVLALEFFEEIFNERWELEFLFLLGIERLAHQPCDLKARIGPHSLNVRVDQAEAREFIQALVGPVIEGTLFDG